MIQRLLAVGLLAGLLAGLAVAALQNVTTTPLILAAEVYETAAEQAHGGAAAHDHAAHEHTGHEHTTHEHTTHEHAPAWEPAPGLERTAATSVATSVTAVGYAFVLLALMLLSGETIEPKRAALWGACAFASTGLATSLGLAPELPGSAAGDLATRQLWWLATAASTGAGLFALLRVERPVVKALGVALLIAPHLIGAPQPPAPESTAPAELAARFAAASLAIHALTWILVGAAVGFVWRFLGQRASREAAA
ncbi:CbtA family protein [Methylosinus sp. H3A]|uniref:CbtA family protein n=1 Tax=Methylosinus sp. H3A TaxID=2785786 RepID=UPI0018C1E99C|nr:CbtA family protein [Methylosinus sp. H3A]MBG0810623.1 CbtA family protein [Methylosinus sp. H3A]